MRRHFQRRAASATLLFACASIAAGAAGAKAALAVGSAQPAGSPQAAGSPQSAGAAGPDRDFAAGGVELGHALRKRGLRFSSFYAYAGVVEAGPGHPGYLEAVQGVVELGDELDDQVFAPNLLRKARSAPFERLPPEVRSRIDYAVALLDDRAGNLAEAEKRVQGIREGSPVFARALLLRGLLAQRKDPARAIGILHAVLDLPPGTPDRDLPALRELAHLTLGRTLYGLRRYPEAAREYGALPRFSRHWDEALFEGAYADLKSGDKGGALGRLHGLHSPHLSDEFAPESENLAAIVYADNCLYVQVKEAAKRFETRYLPMRDRMQELLAGDRPLSGWVELVRGAPGLPSPVLRHLRKNERVGSLLGYLSRLEEEAGRIEAAADLPAGAPRAALREVVSGQRALAAQVAGRFIRGRLEDLAHLIDVLDREKEIIVFEALKGEKSLLEANVDVREVLGRQQLSRPEMPTTGHEYWPFDGEYWPDEIGYYRYTLKNACPPQRKDEAP